MGSFPPGLRRRVLLAVARETRPRMSAVVRGWDARYVESAADFVRALAAEHHDLIIVGAHFDESNVIDALKQALSRAQRTPVVCLHGTGFTSALGAGTVQALRLASEALGAHSFLDLSRFPDDAQGNARLRAMIERLFEPNSGSGP
jgi:hypothetical protein